MEIDDIIDIIRACRRSRVKLRVYDAVKALRVAPVPEIADRAKTTTPRVLAVMLGDDEDYKSATSLVNLRVAEPRETSAGLAFAITLRGEAAHARVRDRLVR